MKIYLFLNNKIHLFFLPKKIMGSFSFDPSMDEESKLINIESKDDNWFLYKTDDVSILNGNSSENSVLFIPNKYYLLQRDNNNYLIYTTDLFDNSFVSYSYSNINLIIGNDQSCNVNFNCEYINGIWANIKLENNSLILERNNNSRIYINDILVLETKIPLSIGDQINIYGLQLFILNGLIFINNPMGRVRFNYQSAGIVPRNLVNDSSPQDIEVKDIDLYTKEDYYSKSPRLRRIIKKKEINLSPPPKPEGESEMPLILTIGPMLTMGIVAAVTLINTISKIYSGTTTLAKSWTSLASSGAMLISMLVWPMLTKRFNKRLKERKKKELTEKYNLYLEEKRKELKAESKLQKEILIENLITTNECLALIEKGKINFWDKRIEQSDFLEVRLGTGNEFLDVSIKYPEEGFEVDENELKEQADKLIDEFKYINDVPIGYSFYKNKITAFMGIEKKCRGLINNIILQLITFYSYEDIKIVLFTNDTKKESWEYLKYLNHSFSNNKSIRFFATNVDEAKKVGDYLNQELQKRVQAVQEGSTLFKPYYVVIVDDYDLIKRHNFISNVTEIDANLGFSLIIREESLSKLPSKCNNFIFMDEQTSGVLKNSYEQQEQMVFHDEVNYKIDMMSIVKKLSNIPIEFQEGHKELPESLTFLEMEKVGKVEQLNILNRWETNDATTSLKAEIGVGEDGNLMYLDLHEKFHGPHGLIAGMTGSGKSEFIITYILSMAINYSPDDVSFILIDYKGGGLAFAFENKATGMCLPHLAGTITNLDKAEMDRTLVSIDSEVKRRQEIFNEARDGQGESTIDIYKYQRLYKEGKVKEAVPHLFIICDEFAELKSQQPDFMDNLISVARIGRSLGVHLILATQKPSGVVNDQIWSNTKFRVCLKVQDASDSKEMLKRPDAASIKQTGRFYLQVGYDEYFALGQSGWCGAQYYPSEKIIKQVDKSVNFIDNTGEIIKSVQASNNIKIEPQGEQLANILKSIIDVSNMTNKKSKRLWLNNIDPIILVDDLIKKYKVIPSKYDVKAIVGEYDAPEKQEQGILTYSLKEQGNTIVFGNDEVEREGFLNTLIYSTCLMHTAEELNIYIIDFGSESLRIFSEFPQVGGMVFVDDNESYKNLFKMIVDELKNRKKLLIPYGGSFENYNSKNDVKLPQIMFILNNYEAIYENNNNVSNEIISLVRDCSRYGIYVIISCNVLSSLGRRISQCFENRYVYHLTDNSDYYGAFNVKSKVRPRDILGRGITNNDGVHEFQTASIVNMEENDVTEYVNEVCTSLKEKNKSKAPKIPSLPEKVTFDCIKESITTLEKVPIGISSDSLKVIKYDFINPTSTSISSNKLVYINGFIMSLLDIMTTIPNTLVLFLDSQSLLPELKEKSNLKYFDNIVDDFSELENISQDEKFKDRNILYIFYGLEKLKTKIEPSTRIVDLFTNIRNSDNSNMIFCDSTKTLKTLDSELWFSKNKNNTDGIWIGKGFGEQQNFRISKITKEMTASYNNNYGFYISESSAELMKLIEFYELENQGDEDEE